jgi:hypothetical protein
MDCIRSLVVGLSLRELFEVVFDSSPEAEVFPLTRIKSIEVGIHLSQVEVNQSEVAQSKLLFSYEFLDVVEFRSGLFEEFDFGGFEVRIEEESSDFLEGIVKYSY